MAEALEQEMSAYFRDCILRQKDCAREGLVHSLMVAQVDGDRLTEEENRRRTELQQLTVQAQSDFQSAQQRVNNASRMVDAALAKGIPKSDIYIDPLVFPISVDSQFGNHCLDSS